ncbi:hypothetical protein ML8HA_02698 [Lactococcus lactis]|nr:hypothetical protein [Lactococcus lactis]
MRLQQQYDKIKAKLIQISETTKAGKLAKTGATDLTREQILSELPAELNEDKLNDLLKTRVSGEKIANFIKTAYPENKLNENLSTRDLERLQAVLTQIEYGKVATVANVKEKFGSFLNKSHGIKIGSADGSKKINTDLTDIAELSAVVDNQASSSKEKMDELHGEACNLKSEFSTLLDEGDDFLEILDNVDLLAENEQSIFR